MAAISSTYGKDGKVPVTVLTGFLGAGKTTLLNHLLSENHGLKFAIIENEFGEVGIDEKILGSEIKEKIDEELIEVMNGCICWCVNPLKKIFLSRLKSKKKNKVLTISSFFFLLSSFILFFYFYY